MKKSLLLTAALVMATTAANAQPFVEGVRSAHASSASTSCQHLTHRLSLQSCALRRKTTIICVLKVHCSRLLTRQVRFGEQCICMFRVITT